MKYSAEQPRPAISYRDLIDFMGLSGEPVLHYRSPFASAQDTGIDYAEFISRMIRYDCLREAGCKGKTTGSEYRLAASLLGAEKARH